MEAFEFLLGLIVGNVSGVCDIICHGFANDYNLGFMQRRKKYIWFKDYLGSGAL